MTSGFSGGCLCGRMRFRIDGAFDRFYLCHCGRCRKDSGSAHGANLFASAATLHWLAGGEALTIYTLPGTRHTHAFCGSCGSAMPYQLGKLLVVPAGALTTPPGIAPDAHLFLGDRAAWDHDLEAIPGFPGLPA